VVEILTARRLIGAAVLGAVLLACQPAPAPARPAGAPAAPAASAAPAPAASAPAPAASPAPVALKVGQTFMAAALVPFWLALDSGAFTAQGLDVESVLMRGSVEGVAALAGGDATLLLGTPSPPFIGAARETGLTVVGTTNNRLQYQIVGNVPTLPDLRGKIVGVARIGDTTQYLTVQALERAGLRPDDVRYLSIGTIPQRTAALLSGQIDATPVIVPSNLHAIKAGYYQLADLGDLGIPYIGASVLLRKAEGEQQPTVIERFLKGLMQGVYAVTAEPDRARAVLRQRLDLTDAEEVEATYQDNVKGLEPWLESSLAGLQDVLTQTVAENPSVAGLRAEDLVDRRYVEAIRASGFSPAQPR
jgi:ABC-type nitrate/sulfonate/bicarbonate transport system substrate-binding protein